CGRRACRGRLMVPDGNCELDDLHLHTPTVNAQARHCHWQGEPPGTGAARVQEHDTVSAIDSRTVRVAGDDDVKLCCRGVEIELTQIVEHVEDDATDLDNLRRRKRDRPGAIVVVAAYGNHRCDLPQRVQHLGAADVAGVDDQLRARQRYGR